MALLKNIVNSVQGRCVGSALSPLWIVDFFFFFFHDSRGKPIEGFFFFFLVFGGE